VIEIQQLLVPKSMNEAYSKSARMPMDLTRNTHFRAIIFAFMKMVIR